MKKGEVYASTKSDRKFTITSVDKSSVTVKMERVYLDKASGVLSVKTVERVVPRPLFATFSLGYAPEESADD